MLNQSLVNIVFQVIEGTIAVGYQLIMAAGLQYQGGKSTYA
jgi:hypothetical protein